MSRSERLVKKLAQVDMGALGWPEAVKTLTRFVEDARSIAAKEWKPSKTLVDGDEHMPWCDGKHDESVSCAGHLTQSKLEVSA